MAMIFEKWETDEVKINDLGIAKYITFDEATVPHTFGRKSRGRFAKSEINIVERLVNKIMRSGQGKRKLSGKYIRGRGSCGKKIQAIKIVENAFEIIEQRARQNPLQVFIDAIEKASPREDTTRFKRGGITYTQSVDVAPLKRVDESIKNIALAAFSNSFGKKVSASEALADEIMLASKEDQKSMAIKRRDEVERIAKSSR